MAIYVNSNVSSLHGQRFLNNVQTNLSTTYNRLSSGFRINSAKDDAAGLQISDRLTSQINGLNQGNRNASDAIALAQTIEGGIDEIHNMLQRARTLAVQASNGTNTKEDRVALQKEANALSSEISRIAAQTTFGGNSILAGYVSAPAAADDADENSLFAAAGSKAPQEDAGKGPYKIHGYGVVRQSIYDKGTAGSNGQITFQVGANQNDTIKLTVQNFAFSVLSADAAAGGDGGGDGGDGDVPNLDGPGLAAYGSAKAPQPAPAPKNGIHEVGDTPTEFDAGLEKGTSRFTLSDHDAASAAITKIDEMIAKVDSQRGELGAIQNRLESSIRNQANVSANQADARSRIRDTDFAEESANLTQQNIIQQAASSMLMQANMRPQLALSLLG